MVDKSKTSVSMHGYVQLKKGVDATALEKAFERAPIDGFALETIGIKNPALKDGVFKQWQNIMIKR